jgi:hypothetical protein
MLKTKGKKMIRRNSVLGHVLAVTVLGVGLLSTASCDEDPLETICAANCADEGVLDGNASITGSASVDSFFRSVVNFKGVAAGVNADIQAELDGIQTAFGVSNADVKAAGNLGAAIKAKIDTKYKAKLVVKAQPAKCEVNASIAAEVTAECQAKAKCEVDPGKASFECMGTCTVDADVDAKCSADADVVCKVNAPDLECKGSCEGSCTAKLDVAASCSGTCVGECSGTCEGDTDMGAGCNGRCTAMCKGSCTAVLDASAMCNGSCSGTCKYKPGSASCDARAKVECELKAEAKAECSGRCEGEFQPPKAECEASASCEASAKAEAKFQAKCTPPSIDVRWTFDASVTAETKADFEYRIADVKARLPRLSASIKKAQLVFDAGAELSKQGRDAVDASLDAFADSSVEDSVKVRIAACAPDALGDSAKVVTDASGALSAKLTAANQVTAAVGM